MIGRQSGHRQTLVAGIGNIFLTDDGFGVEVVRRLASLPLPANVTIADFGIRGIHLAFEMLDGGYDRVLLVDALASGDAPGTLRLMEADDRDVPPGQADAHSMHPAAVLAYLRSLGETPPPVTVVGCQPACISEGMGLTAAVEAAVDVAVHAVLDIVCAGGPSSCA
jgi:hydrogenase maturation protease